MLAIKESCKRLVEDASPLQAVPPRPQQLARNAGLRSVEAGWLAA